MIGVQFSRLAGTECEYELNTKHSDCVRVYTASFCSSMLCFVGGGGGGGNNTQRQPIRVPEAFTLQISSSEGTREVYPFRGIYFALSHSAVHTLVYKSKTVLCITPAPSGLSAMSAAPIIKKRDRADLMSSYSSLASSEEVSRISKPRRQYHKCDECELTTTTEESNSGEEGAEMRAYIRENGDCDALRNKIDKEGVEAFYYSGYTEVPVCWEMYYSFVTDCDCWCGHCHTTNVK